MPIPRPPPGPPLGPPPLGPPPPGPPPLGPPSPISLFSRSRVHSPLKFGFASCPRPPATKRSNTAVARLTRLLSIPHLRYCDLILRNKTTPCRTRSLPDKLPDKKARFESNLY